MKTFRMTSLPEEIIHNGKTYLRLIAESAKITLGEKVDTTDCVKVLVLNSRLKGINDLHGLPYKPTEWLFRLKPAMNALHVITCRYSRSNGMNGSKVILRSDRFRQSKLLAYDSSKRDSLHQGWDYLAAYGFKPIGTGEGKDHMYIVCEVLKPLKQ